MTPPIRSQDVARLKRLLKHCPRLTKSQRGKFLRRLTKERIRLQ